MKRIRLAALLVISALQLTVATAQPKYDPWDYRGNYGTAYRWDPSWNSRPFPPRGACFFTRQDYGGNRFCVRAGDRLPYLPGNFGNNISSIQIFGGSRVTVFRSRNFSGPSSQFTNSIRDLRNRHYNGYSWNNSISSIVLR